MQCWGIKKKKKYFSTLFLVFLLWNLGHIQYHTLTVQLKLISFSVGFDSHLAFDCVQRAHDMKNLLVIPASYTSSSVKGVEKNT